MIDRHVSMSEIAGRLGLTLPAVSNWRRRHRTFPAPVKVDGRELFPVEELAAWLDGRRISKRDLGPDELPGTTYGTRFRDAMTTGHVSDVAIDALFREILQLRGAEDVAVFADVVLGCLYLAIVSEDSWNDVVTSKGSRLGGLPAATQDPAFPVLRSAFESLPRRGEDQRLALLIELIERVRGSGRGVDVFDLLLDKFATEEGRRDATVYTPTVVVRLVVELAALARGSSVFDPCCGSGGFLLGAAKYAATHRFDASFTGYALSTRSRSLAHMSLRLHRVRASVDVPGVASFPREGWGIPERGFDVVLSNPPFDLKAETDFEGRYGSLPKNRTSFAWLQYVLSSLAAHGRAAVVMPGGTLFREGAEKQVRTNMVDDGVVDAIIALPPQLFVSTAVPVTVWLLSRSEDEREKEILFVDASRLGHMISRTQRSLSDEDLSRIVDTVASWRAGDGHEDVPGFSASVTVGRIREQDYVLVPARYVGTDFEAPMPVRTADELRDELRRLEWRAAEVDTAAERALDRVETWIR